jgi:hypothetical protein
LLTERLAEAGNMIALIAEAEGTGRVVDWSRFKRGQWVDAGWLSFGFSTVIPDVIVDVLEWCRTIDPACRVETLRPSGITTAQFDVAIIGTGYQVICGRRLARGCFPLNPLAAEFGSNYDVLLTISSSDREIEEKLAEFVSGNYRCRKAIDSE